MAERLATFFLYVFPDFPERIENWWIASRIMLEKVRRKRGRWASEFDAH
jgi:hypothetical protein